MRSLRISFLLLLIAPALFAQDHPNDARGFAPEKAFHVGDFDTINAFNGNLIVTLPLGPTYPVKADLAYGLTLVYNSKVWDIEDPYLGAAHVNPTRVSNTGMGWRLSLGRFWAACVPNQPCDLSYPSVPAYEGPDGAVHDFFATLHSGDPTPPSGVIGYTRDGSYLRLLQVTSGWNIEEPGGIIRHFEQDPTSNASNDTRLTSVQDRFGNKLTVSYDNDGISWSIADDDGRTQTVHKKVIQVPSSEIPADGHAVADIPPNLANVIDYVDVVAPDSNAVPPAPRTLRYVFNYEVKETARGCSLYSLPAGDLKTIYIPYLTSITVSDASNLNAVLGSYTFTRNVTADYSTVCGSGANVGTMASMTMPTGGAVAWTYGSYPTPDAACSDTNKGWIVGVTTRTLTDGVNSAATWTYSPTLVNASGGQTTGYCSPGVPYQTQQQDLVVTVTDPVGNVTKNYFTTWNENRVSANGTKRDENGLPFVRSGSAAAALSNGSTVQRYLSRSSYKSDGTVLRSTYLTYERDAGTQFEKACNHRVAGTRDVYADDNNHYKDVASSSFDGVGHYRSETATGDLWAADKRVSYTDYNASSGDYTVGTTGNLVSTYYGPPSTWLLNLFTYQTVTENGETAKVESSFSTTTGALNSARTLKNNNAVEDAHDLLTYFCRDSYGNVTSERHFGADGSSIASQNCNATPSYAAGEYLINHEYSGYGPRTKSSYGGLSPTMYFLDQTIDRSGTPSSSRDTSGLQTNYGYDVLGRLTSVTPPGAAWSEYVYKLPGETYNSTTVSLPTVFVNVRGAGTTTSDPLLRQEKYEYDKLGRLIRQSHLGPDGNWSATQTSYDGVGRKLSVSEPESTGTSAPTSPLTATLKTTYTYDEFGRPTQVQSPDNSVTTYTYHGIRENSVRKTIATGATTTTDATTTSDHDSFGRLRKVSEPSGPAPAGANVDTIYGYDVGGHLSSVEMKGAEGVVQNRVFDYDGRGFLRWETHPESGMTAYSYDALGHVTSKTQSAAGTLFDLQYQYDSAGRLLHVLGRNPYYVAGSSSPDAALFRPIKDFTYAPANDTTVTPNDFRQGKLLTAVRYNYPPDPGAGSSLTYLSTDIYRVTETYTYADAAGRKTSRTTTIEKSASLAGSWTTIREIGQSVSYNDLDLPKTITYPTCINCGLPSTSPDRQVTPTYSQGRVTAIPDFVTSISYWPNGMRNQLLHTNNIIDTQTLDKQDTYGTGMPRPGLIKSEYYTACTPPVITADPQGDTITSAKPSVTLQVTVAGTAPFTYQWYTLSPAYGPISGATQSSYVAAPSVTTTYYVNVQNACRTVGSGNAVVTVGSCTPPTASAGAILNPDSTVLLHMNSSGTQPVTVTWYSGNTALGTGTNLTVGPISSTTTYSGTVTNACGTASATARASIVVPVPAPAGLAATKTAADQITVTWLPVSGAPGYKVQRRDASGWADAVTTAAAPCNDGGRTSGVTYAYRVCVFDPNNPNAGCLSPYSNIDIATMMTFTPVASGSSIQVAPFNELLQAVNAVRATAGWTAVTWNNILAEDQPLPNVNVQIMASHLLALRGRMNEALQALGVVAGGYAHPDPNLQTISASDITELQQRAQ